MAPFFFNLRARHTAVRRARKAAKTALSIRQPQFPTQKTCAAPYSSPRPQPPILRIPPELRLRIYGYVFSTALLHIHYYKSETLSDGTILPSRYTWTPCVAPMQRGLLCSTPPWATSDPEAFRCSFCPGGYVALVHAVDLMWTCRTIYEEAKVELFREATLSIKVKDFPKVAPQLQAIEKKRPFNISLYGDFNNGTLSALGMDVKGLLQQPNQLCQAFTGLECVSLQICFSDRGIYGREKLVEMSMRVMRLPSMRFVELFISRRGMPSHQSVLFRLETADHLQHETSKTYMTRTYHQLANHW